MINGRDEMFSVKGSFSKAELGQLESYCANIEEKLNRKYGPQPGEKVDYFWNPIRFFVQSRTTSSDDKTDGIRIAVHSSAKVAIEGRDDLSKLGYETGELIG